MDDKIKFENHDLSQPVNFTILNEMEMVMGKKSTPAIKLGMKCTNDEGHEFDRWVNHVLWGTEASTPYTTDFLSKINKDIKIHWDGDTWSGYDASMQAFKFAKGRCTLKTKVVGETTYYNIDQILPYQEIPAKQEQPKENTITDEDIPF